MNNHPNVQQAVYTSLLQRDKALADRWEQDFGMNIAHLEVKNQLKAVNAFWRTELGSMNVSTIEARECLLDDMGFEDWCRNFDKVVVPVILSFWQ